MRYLGQDPYILYNGPTATQPPEDYWRVRIWTYGCAIFAAEEEGKKVRAIGSGAAMGRVAQSMSG